MTEPKLCGFDPNGWRDFAAGNWRSLPGEEQVVGPVEIVPSGPLSSVVSVGPGQDARWIGGPQADRAPHGCGGGWGDIGDVSRRAYVRSLLKERSDDVGKLAAALLGSSHGSAHTVLSIDDGTDGNEAAQEYLLDAQYSDHVIDRGHRPSRDGGCPRGIAGSGPYRRWCADPFRFPATLVHHCLRHRRGGEFRSDPARGSIGSRAHISQPRTGISRDPRRTGKRLFLFAKRGC